MAAELRAGALAEHLGGKLHGQDCVVSGACTLRRMRPGCLCFIKGPELPGFENVPTDPPVCFLVPPALTGRLPFPHITVDDPRASFARSLADFFVPKRVPGIHPSAQIGPNTKLGVAVTVGAFSVIGADVEVGDYTEIRHHVVIGPGTRIGHHCLLKSHSVLGEEGFGVTEDEAQNNVRIPHIGNVEIGDYVEVGAFNTVCRGTIDPTIIGNHVKMDDHVHVAHNVCIGANSIITACAEISGSAFIGARVWLGPNCSIMNGIEIGDHALVGLGAVVTKSVSTNAVVAGNPARVLRRNG